MSSVLGLRGMFASKAEVEQLFGEITVRKVVLTGEGGAEQSRDSGGEAFVQLDQADAAQALDELRNSRFVECVNYCPRELVASSRQPLRSKAGRLLAATLPCTPG